MLLRQCRRLVTALSLVLWALAACALVWGVVPPDVIEPMIAPAATNHSKNHSTRMSVPRPELAQFEPFWDRPLRSPLFDPPVVVETPPPPPPPPPLTIRLVGTVVEPGRALAILVNAAGKIEMKAVGQTTGDPAQPAEILAVERDHVSVRYAGETRELALESR